MTDEERAILRAQLAQPIITVQNRLRERGVPSDEFVPELIAALLSLAAMIAAENAGMEPAAFLAACFHAAEKQWPDDARLT